MAAPLASVVVVSREGFRQAPACLARLLVASEAPFRLIYVDGHSPSRIARRLHDLVASHGGTLLRTDRLLRPAHARNLGFHEVDTRYAVFLDDNVLVTEGWLDALVRCAERTNAAYVTPVICIGGQTPPVVHVAGGVNRIVEEAGRRRLLETYAHATRPLADVLAEVACAPTTMAEFHAVLVRTESLRALGGLDERCPTAFEHNDLCLSLAVREEKGWLEPASIVDYVPDAPAAWANAPYHLLRWCRSWIDESRDGFCAKWNLDRSEPGLTASLEHLHGRRRAPTRFLRAVVRRFAGAAAADRLDALSDWCIDNVWRRYQESRLPRLRISRWPGPCA